MFSEIVLLARTITALCPVYAPFFGAMGVMSALVFTGI